MNMLSFASVFVLACTQALPLQTFPESIQCFQGNVDESDLANGEMLLNENDVVKIHLDDQEAIRRRISSSAEAVPTEREIAEYGLAREEGWRWVISTAGGLFGRDENEARVYFAEHAEINASYYPATKMVIVSSLIPEYTGSAPYGFLVFVRIPNGVVSISYDCASFK